MTQQEAPFWMITARFWNGFEPFTALVEFRSWSEQDARRMFLANCPACEIVECRCVDT